MNGRQKPDPGHDIAVDALGIRPIDLDQVSCRIADIQLKLASGRLEQVMIVERIKRKAAALLCTQIDRLEIIHIEREMRILAGRRVHFEQVKLVVAHLQPFDLDAKVRRGDPRHAEHALIPSERCLEIDGAHADMVETQGSCSAFCHGRLLTQTSAIIGGHFHQHGKARAHLVPCHLLRGHLLRDYLASLPGFVQCGWMTTSLPGTRGKVAIIGGSIGGLFAALLLNRAGWDVNIFERNTRELAGRGAGIVTHPALHAALHAAGIVSAEDLGVTIPVRRTFGRDGALVGERAFPQTNTSWDRLFQLLRAALPEGRYHLGKSLTFITQTTSGATAHFADGSETSADLVIGADGFRSSVRAAFLPDVTPVYAGYIAWRGLVDENAFSRGAHEALFGSFSFCLPPGEQMLGYPVAGPGHDLRPGHRRFNFVWYRPAAEGDDLTRLLTDESGIVHDVSIPPPLISRHVIAEMRAASQASLAPCFAEAVALTSAPFFQPIYDLAVPRMSEGRVAIIGDAAFVARPHVGAGVTKAAEDAMALVAALARYADMDAALAAFDKSRTTIGHRIITRARHLGAYMQAQVLTPAEQDAAEKHRSAEAVMQETASLAFLDA